MEHIESKVSWKNIYIYNIYIYIQSYIILSRRHPYLNKLRTANRKDSVNHSSTLFPIFEAKKDIKTSKANSHFFSRDAWDQHFVFGVAGTVCILAILEPPKKCTSKALEKSE